MCVSVNSIQVLLKLILSIGHRFIVNKYSLFFLDRRKMDAASLNTIKIPLSNNKIDLKFAASFHLSS